MESSRAEKTPASYPGAACRRQCGSAPAQRAQKVLRVGVSKHAGHQAFGLVQALAQFLGGATVLDAHRHYLGIRSEPVGEFAYRSALDRLETRDQSIFTEFLTRRLRG